MKTLLLATCLAIPLAPVFAAGPSCSVSEFPTVSPAASTSPTLDMPQVPPQLELPALPIPSDHGATFSDSPTIPRPLQHIVASGATLARLDDYHGLQRFVSRAGDQIMVLSVTPDALSVVGGLMSDLSARDLEQLAGPNLTEIGSFHGLRGMLVRSGPQFQVFYATPDGERVIPGVMWDVAGKNLTREQTAKIAGMVPTVVIGEDAGTKGQSPPLSTASAPGSDLSIAEATNFGLAGRPDVPRLWMFIDPLCSFSVRAMQQLQPYVASGKVQLAVVPLAVIDHETNGRSTTNALAMLSKPTDQMIAAWSNNDLRGVPAPEASDRLRSNMEAAQKIRLEGTPTLIWRKADGAEGRSDGLPSDLNAVIASLGK